MASLAEWVDQLQATGTYTFTKDDAIAAVGASTKAVEKAVRRLKEKRRVAQARQEFYVIVPLEYRSAGAPPPSWYIDDLMRFEGQAYYVGLLSAAALHGAAHQRPQEFQVLCQRTLRVRVVGRSRIRFFQKKEVQESRCLAHKTETGSMRVSTPEQTAADLLRYVRKCGGLSNVATVLAEMGDQLEASELIEVLEHEERSNAQRLGFLLESIGYEEIGERLHRWLAERDPSRVPLMKGGTRDAATLDDRWQVYVNVQVEPDL